MRISSRFCGRAGLLLVVLMLGGCGGRAISKRLAHDVIARLPAEPLTKGEVEVLSVSQVGSGEAIVVTNLRSAFRLEKVRGQWQVREIRIGKGEWVKLDNVLLALQQVRIEEARRQLDLVGNAVEAYRQKNGRLPEFKSYVELADALSPAYLAQLIRLDPWDHPLHAFRLTSDSLRLVSAGPDGKFGTPDDIELSRTYSARQGGRLSLPHAP